MEQITSVEVKCLVPICDRLAACRGLCSTHYNLTKRLVARSIFDWDELERDGKVAERSPRGPQTIHKQWTSGEEELIEYYTSPVSHDTRIVTKIGQ